MRSFDVFDDLLKAMPGVVDFVTAADVPGMNSVDGQHEIEPIFATGEISFAGQAVGLIVADSYVHASEAAKKVKLAYGNVKPPVLTIQDALGSMPRKPTVRKFNQMKNGRKVGKSSAHNFSDRNVKVTTSSYSQP